MAQIVGSKSIGRMTEIERCPRIQTNVRWPVPVDIRLNELLGRVTSLGEISRSQLIAALVSSAPSEPDRLREIVEEYRSRTAGEVVLRRTGPISPQKRKPGRRSL